MRSQFDKVQYDKLGAVYEDSKKLPQNKFELATVKAHVGDVSGLRVLDLACGTGYWSRKLLEWGAKEVVGVDISPEMVKEARRQSGADDQRAQFHVGDCSKPLEPLGFGRFDLVIAIWMVNYIDNAEDMSTFWENVANSLKPGGRCIGTVPNHVFLTQGFPKTARCGVLYEGLEPIENGVKMQATMYTENPFTFQCYLLEHEVIETCAAKAGVSLQWVPLANPNDPELDFEEYSRMPNFEVFMGATVEG